MLKKAIKMKKLRWESRHNFFIQGFYEGEICRYVYADFMFGDVKILAKKNDVTINYCSPGTEDYKRFGCNCFEITSYPEHLGLRKEEFKPVLFDPATLMI